MQMKHQQLVYPHENSFFFFRYHELGKEDWLGYRAGGNVVSWKGKEGKVSLFLN